MSEETKTCPRCHEVLDKNARFCSHCGWEFRKGNKNRPQRRRWKEESFQNTSFTRVMNWLRNCNGHIEIVNVRGNLKYDTSGIIFKTRDWYVQYLTIRYYDDDKANKSYALVYDEQYDFLLRSGATKAVDNCMERVGNNPMIFNIVRSSHYSGGGSKEYSCAMAIYEI
jgi:hypothetical protein